MRKSSKVRIATAVSAFILVAGLMLLPAVSKGMAMSMTTAAELSRLMNPTSMQGMQGRFKPCHGFWRSYASEYADS